MLKQLSKIKKNNVLKLLSADLLLYFVCFSFVNRHLPFLISNGKNKFISYKNKFAYPQPGFIGCSIPLLKNCFMYGGLNGGDRKGQYLKPTGLSPTI